MDYEFYYVDPYFPLDPDTNLDLVREVLPLFSPAYQKAEAACNAFFTPTIANKARILGDALMYHCETVEELEMSLLDKYFRDYFPCA